MRTGPMSLDELIDIIRSGKDVSDAYYVYADAGLADERDASTQVYVEKAMTFDAGNNEVLPDPVRQQGLEPFCSIELIQSVVDNAVDQKPTVDNAGIVAAFDHYMKNDEFIDLDD